MLLRVEKWDSKVFQNKVNTLYNNVKCKINNYFAYLAYLALFEANYHIVLIKEVK